jgi:alpha-mannosidase
VLPPGDYLETDVALTMSPDAAPGLYPVRAELAVTGADVTSMPPAWRQVVEDVCIVSVGTTDDQELLRLISGPEAVEVNAGSTATLAATVGTDAYGEVAIEAHLISPWGTWEWLGPTVIGTELAARGTVELVFDVAPPVWVEPGEWWALIRIGCAGQLLYSPAVKVTVR